MDQRLRVSYGRPARDATHFKIISAQVRPAFSIKTIPGIPSVCMAQVSKARTSSRVMVIGVEWRDSKIIAYIIKDGPALSIDRLSQRNYNPSNMKILLTNDDGILAPGLIALHKRLCRLGEVITIAPVDCHSGMSHSITYAEPLTCTRITRNGIEGFGVKGSPADCVKLGCMQLYESTIDLIVSGINHGANVGLNIYYSGTVAAALEGGFMGIPSVAVSLAMDRLMDFEAAADLFISVLEQNIPLAPGDILNINIPPLSQGDPHGIRVVPQSTLGFQEYYVSQNMACEAMAFLLQGGQPHPETPATDTMLLSEGFITVTPLQSDMTNHTRLDAVRARFENISQEECNG